MAPEARRLELAALLRLGLGPAAAFARDAPEDEPLVDALVRAGALRRGQALAVRAYIDKNAVLCSCGERSLAPEESAEFACPSCGASLARAGWGEERARPPAPARLEPGSRIGPLELLEVVGRGAFGTVWKARHTLLGRLAAVKVVPGAAFDRAARKRFEREVVAQARLDHPGIARIHAAYEVGNALACEMDFVPGETLGDRIARAGALEWREAARIVLGAARAIDHAHRRGVLHRDLKPANVLLRSDDGAPLVIDLGLARFLDQASSLTRVGAIPGTPAYVAPEALAGKVAPSLDVYGLGAILHEALAGKPPFSHEERLVELFAKIGRGERTPLGAHGGPADLERVAARAMAVDPRSRHQTAGELADDLERVLAGKPISVPAAPGARSRNLALSAGAAALVLSLAAATMMMRGDRAGPSDPGEREARALSLLEKARNVRGSESSKLAQEAASLAPASIEVTLAAAELLLRAGDAALARAILERAAGQPTASSVERATVDLARARALRALGEREAALALLGSREGSGARLAVTLLTELGRPKEAVELARPLAAKGELAARVDACLGLGEALLAQGDAIGAREAFSQARELQPKAGAPLAGLALVFLAIGAPEDALEAAEEACRLSPDDAFALHARAGARLLLLDLEGARADAKLASSLAPSPRAALAGRELALALESREARGAWARALLREARRAAVVARELRRPELVSLARRAAEAAVSAFPDAGSAHASLAIVLIAQGEGKAALESARVARARSPEDAAARIVFAEAQTDDGRFAEAQALASGIAAAQDEEARAGGARLPALEPSSVACASGEWALARNDPASGRALAREALEKAETRRQRARAASLLVRVAELERAELAALRSQAFKLEPRAAEARAILRAQHASDERPTLDAAIAGERWEPAHRILRARLLLKDGDLSRAIFDLATAATTEPDDALQAVVPLVWDDDLQPLRERLRYAGTGEEEIALRLHPDSEATDLPKAASRPEEAAVPLARAVLALSAPEPARARASQRALAALAHLDLAESVSPVGPAVHALRSLALERLSAGAAAGRERARFSMEVAPHVDAAFLALRARRSRDPGLALLAARAREALEGAQASAARLDQDDLSGASAVLERLGDRKRAPAPPEVVRVFLPEELASGAGWRLEESEGERVLTGSDPDRPLEIAFEGDVLEADLVTGPGAAPLRVRVLGETDEISLERNKPGRRTLTLAAGLPPGRHVVAIAPAARSASLLCVFSRRHASEPEMREVRRAFARACELGLGRPPGSAEDEIASRSLSPLDAAWRAAALDEVWEAAGRDGPAYVKLVFLRLVGRAPSESEAALWSKRLAGASDRSVLPRALARSLEFRKISGL